MRRVDKLATFMCRLFRNSESLTYYSPQGLSRRVCELLYFDLLRFLGYLHFK